MKRIRITLCLLIFTAIATVAMGGSAAAQTLVVGTGDPEVDVLAVQAAVDQGGEVILKGHFSFDRPPTVPTALGGGGLATILVSKAVAISGERDDDRMRHEQGEMTSIEGGTTPSMSKFREPLSPFSDCASSARSSTRLLCTQPAA